MSTFVAGRRLSRRSTPSRLTCAVATAVSLTTGTLPAQEPGSVSSSPWFWSWTPLRTIGGVGMPAPDPMSVPPPGLPTPAIGLGWTASNPAGLAMERGSSWTQATAMAGGAGGDYRSPLAPSNASSIGAELAGWRPLGARSAVIGRVATERTVVGAGTRAILLDPDAASPITPADTNAPASLRTRVTLEGADAVQVREWSFGLALGYDGVSDHASRSAVAVVRRATTAGVVIGVARTVGTSARWGISVRHRLHTETANLFPNPRPVVVYPLDGYLSVAGQDYSLGGEPFFRRLDESADAAGVGAAGTAHGIAWTTYANAERSGQRQMQTLSSTAPVARWRASGWSAGGALQRAGRSVVATVRAGIVAQHGAKENFGGAGHFTADASAATVAGDVRWFPAGRSWSAAAVIGTDRIRYVAVDRAARATTDIVAWKPSVSATLTRGADWRQWNVSYGVARYMPFATIPPAGTRGPAYRALIAPAIEIASAPAVTHTLSVDRALVRGATRSIVRVSWSTTAAARRAADATTLPDGSRSQWALSLSIAPAREQERR